MEPVRPVSRRPPGIPAPVDVVRLDPLEREEERRRRERARERTRRRRNGAGASPPHDGEGGHLDVRA